MTKITNLDKNALIALRDPINAELKALADRLGLTMVLGNGTFGDGAEATFKLVIRVDDPATKEKAARADWDRRCQYVGIDWDKPEETGLRPADFGTEFLYGGTRYRACGLSAGRKASKFPVLASYVEGPTAGTVMMLPEAVVPMIRAATDQAA